MTDLISREAAIAWHIERRDEAKASADLCRNEDEEAACRYLEEAILHGDAINAFRALPAQAPAVKVMPFDKTNAFLRMREAFRTTESGPKTKLMVFSFRSLADLQAADAEWLAFDLSAAQEGEA